MLELDPSAQEFWRGRTVFITGANGFIGANLIRHLLALNANVHVLLRPSAAIWRIENCIHQLIVHIADLRHEAQVISSVVDSRPDVIFHLATGRGVNQNQRTNYVQTGILGAAHIVEALRRLENCRLVVAGSSLEYGSSDGPISESCPLAPHTLHGAVKAAASILLSQAALAEQLAISQLRLFHVYGPWESSHRFLPRAFQSAIKDTSVDLVSGLSRRDWVYVIDVVRALLLAAHSQAPTGIYNIGSGVEHTNEEVLTKLEQVLDRKILRNSNVLPPRLTDQAHRYADISAARIALDWSPRYDLTTGIKSTLSWWNEYPTIWENTHDSAPIVQ